jgi:hypothetical protein
MAAVTASWRMMFPVIELRKIPLFACIGLMWWLVLLAWPPSRPFVLIARPAPGLDPGGHVVGALGTLAHALAAAWIGVHLLRLRAGRPLSWDLPICTILLVWLAITSWSMIQLFAGEVALDVFFRSLLLVPVMALMLFPQVTWVLVLLAIVTVWLVHRASPMPGTTGPPASP